MCSSRKRKSNCRAHDNWIVTFILTIYIHSCTGHRVVKNCTKLFTQLMYCFNLSFKLLGRGKCTTSSADLNQDAISSIHNC